MSDLKKEIFDKVEEYFKKNKATPGDKITVGFPCFDHKEVNQALDSLLDVWISQGPKVQRFEKEFSDYVGMPHGIACNSGSSANLLALTAMMQAGRLSPGDEVIVPAATFTTVISPILQVGLVPVFVDVEMNTYNICPDAIKRAITDKTKLIMIVHSLGCPADMDGIMAVSKKHDIPILEDCCEAHGSSYNKKMVGSFGVLSTWSFFVAHNMTTGEGGMVLTDDDELEDILRSIREFGRLKKYEPNKPRFYYNDGHLKDYDERYVFTNIGYNLRMTDIAASLGIEQLNKLDSLNSVRSVTAMDYIYGLIEYDNKFIVLPTVPKNINHTFYGFPILVKEDAPFTRKDIVNALEAEGIETRAFMGGDLSVQPAYRDTECRTHEKMPNTIALRDRAFFIGCHPYLDRRHIDKVINTFKSFLSSYE